MSSPRAQASTRFVVTVARAVELAAVLRSGRADLIELRLDLEPALMDQIGRCPLPVLATLRSRSQGGESNASPATASALLQEALRRGAALVDLELERDDPGGFPAGQVVLSHHDPHGTPLDLESLFERLAAPGPAVAKLACLVRSGADLVRLLSLRARAREAGVAAALVGMGDIGVPARILAAKLGLALAFAAPPGEAARAPGQLDLGTLADVYGALALRPESPVYAVVGMPVGASGSPRFHNATMRTEAGVAPAVYVPLELPDLESLPALADALDIQGMSVTMPHKERVAGILGAAPHLGAAVPSVNTVWRAGGGWQSASTDGEGLLRALERASFAVEGRRVVLLGAGGAARAATAALAGAGARVLVVARRIERAREVALLAGGQGEAASLDELDAGVANRSMPLGAADLVVNATPVGQGAWGASELRRLPAPPHAFGSGAALMDMVSSPVFTPWLAAGRFSGHRVVHGFAMLVHQALAQQRLWIGRSGDELEGRRALLDWIDEGEPRLWLVGPRGSGKSTAGQLIASELGVGLVDLDLLVARSARMPAGELMQRRGEAALREVEELMIGRVLGDRRGPVVVATGGGAILEHGATFARRGIVAYLHAEPAELARRVRADTELRPPLVPGLSPEEEARHILGRRDALYRAAASVTLDTTALDPARTAAALKAEIGWLQAVGPTGRAT